MNGLSKREKSLLIVLGLAIVFYLYYSFFFKPIMGKADTVKASVDKYQVQVDRIRNAKTLIEKQKSDLEKLKGDLLLVLEKMPDKERNPEISVKIKNMAIDNGAAINSIAFSPVVEYKPEEKKVQEDQNKDAAQGSEQNKDQNASQNAQAGTQNQGVKLSMVPVTVGVAGEYGQIMKFIAALETDTRIAQVGTALLSKGQDGKLTGTLGVVFFYSGGVSGDSVNYSFNDGRTDGKADLFK